MMSVSCAIRFVSLFVRKGACRNASACIFACSARGSSLLLCGRLVVSLDRVSPTNSRALPPVCPANTPQYIAEIQEAKKITEGLAEKAKKLVAV